MMLQHVASYVMPVQQQHQQLVSREQMSAQHQYLYPCSQAAKLPGILPIISCICDFVFVSLCVSRTVKGKRSCQHQSWYRCSPLRSKGQRSRWKVTVARW